jgi:hypothetical protein
MQQQRRYPAWEREPLTVAAIDKPDVLPARWANHLLRRGASAPLLEHTGSACANTKVTARECLAGVKYGEESATTSVRGKRGKG